MVVNGINIGEPSEDELMHYGIMGMKWGVRRYQPYSVRGRKSGKTGKEIGEAKKSPVDKKKAKRERQKAARKAKAEYEANKREAIASGSAKAVSPYLKNMSNKELADTRKRIEDMSAIKKLSAAEKSDAQKRIDKAIKTLDTINYYTKKGLEYYDTATRVKKIFSDPGEPTTAQKQKQLPVKKEETKSKEKQQNATNNTTNHNTTNHNTQNNSTHYNIDKAVFVNGKPTFEGAHKQKHTNNGPEKITANEVLMLPDKKKKKR